MSEFGEELRRERESRGIALESIVSATKISSRYLIALETGHFSSLPGGVFNKGIVRSYARFIGLDEESWVNRFMSAYQGSGQLKDDDASWIAFAENVGKNRPHDADRSGMGLKWAGVAVLVVLLVALGWFVWHYVSDKMTAHSAAQQPVVTATAVRPVPRSPRLNPR
jgi:cytoskeleton protein RodZ